MHTISRVDIGRGQALYPEIERKLADLAAVLRKRYRIDRILVFGSYARRDLHEGSDIDMVVVGDFPLRFHERPSLVRDLTDLPVEPLCYTPEEFAALVEAENPFIAEVLEEAVGI